MCFRLCEHSHKRDVSVAQKSVEHHLLQLEGSSDESCWKFTKNIKSIKWHVVVSVPEFFLWLCGMNTIKSALITWSLCLSTCRDWGSEGKDLQLFNYILPGFGQGCYKREKDATKNISWPDIWNSKDSGKSTTSKWKRLLNLNFMQSQQVLKWHLSDWIGDCINVVFMSPQKFYLEVNLDNASK